MPFIIQDWTGQQIGTDEFDGYYDAREAISELAAIEAGNNYNPDVEPEKYEELFDGVCDDLYAIKVDANGNELPITSKDTELL